MEHKEEGIKNSQHDDDRSSRNEVGGGLPIHSQVMKIKQEFEKTKHPSLQQLEVRHVVICKNINRQRSRSPLGLAERPISVGH